jgi:hypothetical protein
LLRGHRKLAVDRQNEQRVQLSRPHELWNICDVHEEEGLEKLRYDLVRTYQQHHLPLCPVTDSINVPEDDAKEHDLSAEPQNFYDHP